MSRARETSSTAPGWVNSTAACHSVQLKSLPSPTRAGSQFLPPSQLTSTEEIVPSPDQAKPWIGVSPGRSTAPSAGSTITDLTCTRGRSEEHTSELQSRLHLVCRLLLEKKKTDLPAVSH